MQENVNEAQENGVTLQDIFKVIWRNIWWLVGITVAGFILTVIVVFAFLKPSYQSYSSVVVNPEKFQSSSASADVSGGLRATETVGKWISENIVISATIEKLVEENVIKEDRFTVNSFKKMVSTKTSSTNLLIEVYLTSSDKDFSQKALSTLLEVGIEKSKEMKEDGTPKYAVMENAYDVVTPAEMGVISGTSKKMYLAIGTVLSLVVSLVFIFFKNLFKQKFTSEDEVEALLNQPVVGIQIDDPKTLNDVDEITDDFINKGNYEKLLTNVEFSLTEGNKVIEFTSAEPNDGKTTTVVNLSRVFADNDRKVLVIDLDLRNPSIYKRYKLEKNNGVTEYVVGKTDTINVHKINDNLDVITSGAIPPNPSVILSSDKLKAVIDSFRDSYDYILLDCPPVLVAPDAKEITKLSDAQLFIISAGCTKISLSKRALKELEGAKANIIGVNLTKVHAKQSNYYYYHSYYSNYGKKADENK